MANVNKVMLLGNLTRDPEVRYTPKGTAVSDIGLAVNRIRSGDNGERLEEVTYVDVTLWGRHAELAGQYLSKGRSVFIEGRLQLDQWEDKQSGQKRQRLRVISENLQFLGGAGGGKNQSADGAGDPAGAAPQQYAQPTQPPAQGGAPAAGSFENDSDDIPF